jgi:hypothetical protein
MNVEIGAEAALFPEKEYINGIFVAVWEFDTVQMVPCSDGLFFCGFTTPLKCTHKNIITHKICTSFS